MALFGRDQLPHRSTLSRFLAALDQPTVEALRTLFHKDLLARKPFPSLGGLVDPTGRRGGVIYAAGARQTGPPRTLPPTGGFAAPPTPVDNARRPRHHRAHTRGD